ncbi:SRPBCC family protein [Algoriphagus terrigena]|uniref:SRPBCC family protein n=1 Tax=Algoriphagus terrigena TaxID=344884 RepID=UPI00040A7771|nr:SRPBCC domain-containing protein [Algoriphagus terrigena]
MKTPLIVRKEGLIDASPAEVWEVITTPKYFEEWMTVPGQVAENYEFGIGSKIEWIDDHNVPYLTGEVIAFVPNQEIVISLQDRSWKEIVAKGTVTYEFHLTETAGGTNIVFQLGDLSIDPESEEWYDAYKSSDEIGSIGRLIFRNRNRKPSTKQ